MKYLKGGVIGYTIAFILIGVFGSLAGSFIQFDFWWMGYNTVSRMAWAWLSIIGVVPGLINAGND